MLMRCMIAVILLCAHEASALEISHLNCHAINGMKSHDVEVVLAWMRVGHHGDDLDMMDTSLLRDRSTKVANYCSHYPDGGWIDVVNEFGFD